MNYELFKFWRIFLVKLNIYHKNLSDFRIKFSK